MLLISKNTTNTLIFTLTERSQLITPYYLFSFTNDSSGVQTLFNMSDSSGYPRRFNEMTLIESTTPDPSNGEVTLAYGWYKYEVYESSSPTLVIANTTGRILEQGKAYVQGFPLTVNSNSNSTNIYL